MNGRSSGVIYRDLITAILATMVIIIAIMFSYLADPNPSQSDAGLASPGSLSVAIFWPPGNDDVDLWLDAPGETHPVFYRNKGGVVWDLLRDDLGHYSDSTPMNYENAFTRGAPAGSYRVNLLCFTCKSPPIDVNVELQEKKSDGRLDIVSRSVVTLTKNGQEKTAIAFEVGDDGRVIRESLNTFFESLANKSGNSK